MKKRNDDSRKGGAPKVGAQNTKRLKKDADSLVSKGVAIQAKIDEESETMTIPDKLSGLDAAIAMYELALEMYPHHADAMYNLAVAILEKVEHGFLPECLQATVIGSIDMFDSIIRRDTSQRAETTGLSHREKANTIRSFFDLIMAARGVTESELVVIGRLHFDNAIRILQGSRDMDLYLLDYGRFLHFCCERLLDGPHYPFTEKVTTGRELTKQATSILSSCLQTECHGGLDLDVFIEASEVALSFLQFLLGAIGTHWDEIPSEFTFCVKSLIEYEQAMVSFKTSEDEVIATLKDIYETLTRFFSVIQDPANFLRYCCSLISLCERMSQGRKFTPDRGDCMFCIGVSLSKNSAMVDLISSLSAQSADQECESITSARLLLSYLAEISTLHDRFSSHPSSSGIGGQFLQLSALQYEGVLASCEAVTVAVGDHSGNLPPIVPTNEDNVAMYFNLACIGWNLGNEIYCASMISRYYNLLCQTESTVPHSEQLIKDIVQDPDIRGVLSTSWFCRFKECGELDISPGHVNSVA